jgi:hypothetical protein
MLFEWPWMSGRLGRWSGFALAVVIASVLGTLAGARVSVTGLERPGSIPSGREAALSRRLEAVAAAIASKDRSRAIYEWRNAYGLALGARGWEAMVTVGDSARQIDALISPWVAQSSGFRAETRQAYLLALFRARDAHAPEGIERVADAFSALGDAEMAARARTMLGR